MQLCRLSSLIQPAFQSAFSHVFLAYNTKHYIGAIFKKIYNWFAWNCLQAAMADTCSATIVYPWVWKYSLQPKRHMVGGLVSCFGIWIRLEIDHYVRGDAWHFNQDICQYSMWWKGTVQPWPVVNIDLTATTACLTLGDMNWDSQSQEWWLGPCVVRVEGRPLKKSPHIDQATKPSTGREVWFTKINDWKPYIFVMNLVENRVSQ